MLLKIVLALFTVAGALSLVAANAEEALPACATNNTADFDTCGFQFSVNLPKDPSMTKKCCKLVTYRVCIILAISEHCCAVPIEDHMKIYNYYVDKMVASIGVKGVDDCDGHNGPPKCDFIRFVATIVLKLLVFLSALLSGLMVGLCIYKAMTKKSATKDVNNNIEKKNIPV